MTSAGVHRPAAGTPRDRNITSINLPCGTVRAQVYLYRLPEFFALSQTNDAVRLFCVKHVQQYKISNVNF